MPLTIPAFSQYNAPMPPLRGLWNVSPQEGDYFVSAEIDWLVSPPSSAVQFSLSGNSPVALSQIVALVVDNGRSGSDVSFVFPDTGFELVVAARNQGIYPVFTNALMFYAVAGNAIAGDVTVLQILNSMPPPIPIVASVAQNHAAVSGIPNGNGSNQLIPPGINGTLNTVNISIDASSSAGGSFNLTLQDGAGHILWLNAYTVPSGAPLQLQVNLPGLALRFQNGVSLIASSVTGISGWAIAVNAYYSTP